mgnify:CR=1 FL=1
MVTKKSRRQTRKVRQLRIRKNISGTEARPRLNVFRSNTNIYAQIIDDTKGNTITTSIFIILAVTNASFCQYIAPIVLGIISANINTKNVSIADTIPK